MAGTHDNYHSGRVHQKRSISYHRAILDRRGNTNDYYYFPGRTPDTHFNDGSWGKLKKELDKRSGVTGWQVRDIRRTFRSGMARLGVSREICEILLNHVTGAGKNELDEIYNRYEYLDEKRAALAKWETHISRLVE